RTTLRTERRRRDAVETPWPAETAWPETPSLEEVLLPPPLTPPHKGEGDLEETPSLIVPVAEEAVCSDEFVEEMSPFSSRRACASSAALAGSSSRNGDFVEECVLAVSPTFPSPLWGGVRGGGTIPATVVAAPPMAASFLPPRSGTCIEASASCRV